MRHALDNARGWHAWTLVLLMTSAYSECFAGGDWLGTRDGLGNVQWECVGAEIHVPTVSDMGGREEADGPGRFHPNSVCVLQGEWYVAGGERSCGAHGELWKWKENNWVEVNLSSPQPNPTKAHVAWSLQDQMVWLEMDRNLIWHEYHVHSNEWSIDKRTAKGDWAPKTTPLVLDDYVVWTGSAADLYILRKASGELAVFPNDAWANYLLQADRAKYLRIANENNVIEFGQHVNRMNRCDFDEKVRFADFKEVFHSDGDSGIDQMAGHPLLPWILLVLSWGAFFVWRLDRSSSPGKQRLFEALNQNEERLETEDRAEVVAVIAHWSAPLKRLVLSNKRVFSTSEIDALFELTEIQSPETLRAKRSRMIQSVNTEFNLLFGYDLIRRKRDAQDRRKVIYKLPAMPPNLVKMLQRNDVHQLHANDRAYRADGIAQDRE